MTCPSARWRTPRCSASSSYFRTRRFVQCVILNNEAGHMKLPGNMQAMMKQAEQMQKKMQEEIALIRVDASAGGGMVSVKMDGKKNVTAVKIDPEVAGDVEMLQDMVMAAFNEAAKKVDEASQEKMSGLLGGLGLPPGMF